MFFKNKSKHKSGKIPLEEIKKMSSTGMSERDIIQNLKSKGYSLDEIESGMMQAVKYGIADEEYPASPMAGTQKIEAVNEFVETERPFSMQDIYGSPQQQQPEVQMQDEIPDELMAPDIAPEDVHEPDVMIEELVEGIMEEKWKKMDYSFDKIRDDMATLKAEIKNIKSQPQLQNDAPREMENRLNDIQTRLEDFDIRIAGLEKAFKQFLPSLTRNIEELSQMVHGMRNKNGYTSEYQ